MKTPQHIIISRTDGIGDVVLTLPMAGFLRQRLPTCRITFIGTRYTRPVVDSCVNVDHCVAWDEISAMSPRRQTEAIAALRADCIVHAFPRREIARAAKRAGIPQRIGTSHRWYHWIYCNRLIGLSRRNADLHEAQLNLELLAPIESNCRLSIDETTALFGMKRIPTLQPELRALLKRSRANVLLHPRTKGSAREWGLDRFSELIDLLPEERFSLYVTGSRDEGASMQDFLERHASRVTDLTGRLSLPDLIAFIDAADGIVAASTGPLHLAAALGKAAVGLYAPRRPIWPRRWGPIGPHATALSIGRDCRGCAPAGTCECMRSIAPHEVAAELERKLAEVSAAGLPAGAEVLDKSN